MVEDTNKQKKEELLQWKCFVLVPGLLTLTYDKYHRYPRVYKATNSPVRMKFQDFITTDDDSGQTEPIA